MTCDVFCTFLFSTREVGRVVREEFLWCSCDARNTVRVCILLSRTTSKRETICLSRDTAKTSGTRGGSRMKTRHPGWRSGNEVWRRGGILWLLFMVNGFVSSHGDISGKVASGRYGMRVKSGGIRVLSSPLLLFVLSNPTFCFSSPSGKGWLRLTPSTPRGADYIDRFMIAALLQGLEGITRGPV